MSSPSEPTNASADNPPDDPPETRAHQPRLSALRAATAQVSNAMQAADAAVAKAVEQMAFSLRNENSSD